MSTAKILADILNQKAPTPQRLLGTLNIDRVLGLCMSVEQAMPAKEEHQVEKMHALALLMYMYCVRANMDPAELMLRGRNIFKATMDDNVDTQSKNVLEALAMCFGIFQDKTDEVMAEHMKEAKEYAKFIKK